MKNPSVATRAKSVMAAVFELPVAGIPDEASPNVIEQWDSLRHMNLVLALEAEFGIEFSDREIPEILSLPKIVQAIEKRSGSH